MTVFGLILAVVLFLILYWLIGHLPVAAETKRILIIVLIVVAIVCVVWLLLPLLPLGARIR